MEISIQREGKNFERVRWFFSLVHPSFTHTVFYLLIMFTIFLETPTTGLSAPSEKKAHELAEEYTAQEKVRYAKELLQLGDEQFDQKNYDQALAAYEQVFLMDPENRKASAKIDILKKQMMKEGKDESSVVKKIYEEEANDRVRGYFAEAKEYLKSRKYGQARFTVEKILLLDPLNKEAQALYEELKNKSGQVAGDHEKREAL